MDARYTAVLPLGHMILRCISCSCRMVMTFHPSLRTSTRRYYRLRVERWRRANSALVSLLSAPAFPRLGTPSPPVSLRRVASCVLPARDLDSCIARSRGTCSTNHLFLSVTCPVRSMHRLFLYPPPHPQCPGKLSVVSQERSKAVYAPCILTRNEGFMPTAPERERARIRAALRWRARIQLRGVTPQD